MPGAVTVHHIINDIHLCHGGAQQIARLLHRGLCDRGIDSRLVSVVACDGEDAPALWSLRADGPYDVRALTEVLGYIRRCCRVGDIIHAHLFPTVLLVSLAARWSRWRGIAVCTEHSTSNRRRGALWGRAVDGLVYSGYDRIVCVSAGIRAALSSWQPRLADKLVVVLNGARLPFRGFRERRPTRRPLVVSVGRLHWLKNYETALRAMALVRDCDFDYHVAGSGPDEARLRSLCAALALHDRTRFLGYVRGVPSVLGEADIFLMPSRWEGFGLAAVEAMNAGLPVVASDVPGIREVVGDEGECALLVDPDDAGSIADALRLLLGRRELRLRLGRAAFERSKGFSADAMVDGHIALYESLQCSRRTWRA